MSTDKKSKPTKRKKNLLVDHPAWAERLSKEWDWEKNDEMGLRPDEITAGSHVKALWRCSACGRIWDAGIWSRVAGRGCSECARRGRRTALADYEMWETQLSREWDYQRNREKGIAPSDIFFSSKVKIAWKCSECGFCWESTAANRVCGTGCPECAKRKSTGRKGHPLVEHLAWKTCLSKEWDQEKNEEIGIRPDEIGAGSDKKVWWRCERGHEWQASVGHRTGGRGCPYCSGKRPVPGETDLAALMPELAREWHPTRNGDLTPQDVAKNSRKTVWWRCECGHEWQATIVNRTRQGCGCPYCSGRLPILGETDLATLMPDLAREWHPTRNGNLTPRDVTAHSSKRVWWQCEHGHEWQATIASRKSGCGCPYCAGRFPIPGETDLQTLMPELAKEWHPTRNDDLTPRDVTKSSGKKVWWRCEHGHEWQATIASRSHGNGCPYCSGQFPIPGETDLATTMPELAREWHPTRNGNLTSRDITKGSGKKVWWRCGVCGHEWQAAVGSRTQGSGCPKCASSRGEKDAVRWAESAGLVVQEQWSDPECRDKRSLPFDLMLYAPLGSFVRAPLMAVALVEYDGSQHTDPNAYFNMKSLTSGRGGFDYVQRHDAIKDAFCEATGRLLIRIPYTITGVEDIGAYIEAELRKDGFGWWFDTPTRPEEEVASHT